MTVSQIIYTAAGRPVMPGDIGGYCIACGISGAGLPAGEWIKDTFMDHDKLHDGSVVCHSCLFCFDDRSSALTTITGKDKPQRMRNYSHFVVNGRWHPLSKAAKPLMWQLLTQFPEVAVIAVSGQKHLIFRARPGAEKTSGWGPWQRHVFAIRRH